MLAVLWFANQPAPLRAGPINTTGQRDVHDPSRIVKIDGTYYVYYTGSSATRRIRSRTSTDLVNWSSGPDIITTAPAWAATHVPTASNYWAPDVVFVDGEYHMYYSVSTFGSQVSGIGLMTNPSLNPAAGNYQWTDRGAVITSNTGSPYNAIDPGIFLNDDGRMWMTFGSFWDGIRITELNPTTGLRIAANSPTPLIARNEPTDQIEAAYLHKRGDAYYLFVNFGTCCAGKNSTYNIRVGRGTSPTGPFFDKNGVNMNNNGGTLFLGTDGNAIGPGHFSIFEENGAEIFTYHYYDGATQNGTARLNWRTLAWTPEGWPILEDTLLPADFNTDGDVNGEDLATWTANFGGSGADADGDGYTDGNDFLLWQRQLGGSAATATSTLAPEPISSLLLAAAAVLATFSRIRRQ